jgi:hypothetical protein
LHADPGSGTTPFANLRSRACCSLRNLVRGVGACGGCLLWYALAKQKPPSPPLPRLPCCGQCDQRTRAGRTSSRRPTLTLSRVPSADPPRQPLIPRQGPGLASKVSLPASGSSNQLIVLRTITASSSGLFEEGGAARERPPQLVGVVRTWPVPGSLLFAEPSPGCGGVLVVPQFCARQSPLMSRVKTSY